MAWKQARLETKIVTKQIVVIGKKNVYLNNSGNYGHGDK